MALLKWYVKTEVADFEYPTLVAVTLRFLPFIKHTDFQEVIERCFRSSPGVGTYYRPCILGKVGRFSRPAPIFKIMRGSCIGGQAQCSGPGYAPREAFRVDNATMIRSITTLGFRHDTRLNFLQVGFDLTLRAGQFLTLCRFYERFRGTALAHKATNLPKNRRRGSFTARESARGSYQEKR